MAILFADLSRSSALARRLDAEQMADLLDQFRSACRRTVHAHGGEIARVQGDGMMATFGYPVGGEHGPLRAVEAAIDLGAAVSRLAVEDLPPEFRPLSIHSGVHAGLVLVVDGDIERGRVDLVGEVPNGVERLSKAARAGEICVSVGALGPDRSRYVIAESLRVATGQGAPVLAAYRVTARRSHAAQARGAPKPGQIRLVGRDQAVGTLRRFVAEPAAGRPLVATISGAPGIGKSRLVAEAASPHEGGTALTVYGYCEDSRGVAPLQPFLQAIRSALASEPAHEAAPKSTAPPTSLALDLSCWPAVSKALGIDAREGESKASVASEIVGLMAAMASQRALTLALDDWQWADDASRQALGALLGLNCSLHVILISRDPAVHALASRETFRIALDPLSPEESRLAIAECLPNVDPMLARDIHQQSGGVPLFVEELCHAVATGRAIDNLPEQAESTAWLDMLVESRVGRLADEAAELVRACSVLGAAFPTWLMREVADASVDSQAFAQAAAADFLSPRGHDQVQFKHVLTRDAVYGTIGRQRRRSWHLKALSLLRSRAALGDHEAVEALAYHAKGAGRRLEQAVFAEQAGDKAMAVFAFDRARVHFVSAQEALDTDPSRVPEDASGVCRVTGKLGMACVFDPLALSSGVSLFERAVAIAHAGGDEATIARAEYWLGYVCYAKGYARRAVSHCERAVSWAARVGDQRLLAQVEATLGQARFSAARYDEALVLLDGALAFKRTQVRPGSGVAIGSAYTLSCKGALLGDRCDFSAAGECFDEAMALLGDIGHPVGSSVRGWIAVVAIWQGRWDEAARVAAEGARIADRAGTRHLLAMCRAMEGYARWQMGGGPDAFGQVREATTWIEQRQGAFTASLNYGWLLDMSEAQGLDAEVMATLAARLLGRARQGDRLGEALGRRALARWAWRERRRDDAERMLRAAERVARVRGSPHEAAANRACRASLVAGLGAGDFTASRS